MSAKIYRHPVKAWSRCEDGALLQWRGSTGWNNDASLSCSYSAPGGASVYEVPVPIDTAVRGISFAIVDMHGMPDGFAPLESP